MGAESSNAAEKEWKKGQAELFIVLLIVIV